MFEFTQDCLLGVEEIDQEHRHLFDLLNHAIYMVNNQYGVDHYSQIKELLEELEQYADQHFSHEETYMEKIRDPEWILQRSQHRMFREKIVEFFMRNIDAEEEQQKALRELINFLARWLYHHIIGSDTLIGKLPPLEQWMMKENPCEFTEDYMTGIEKIDNEHKMLFDIVDRASNLVRSWSAGDSYDAVMNILKELKGYAEVHFENEERYMREIGYEGYEAQRRAHEAFISRLEEIDEEQIEENPATYLQSLVEFLLGWLINHILQSDKKIPVK